MNAISTKDSARFLSMLKNSGRTLIVTHSHPDGDAIGAAIALKHFICEKLGNEAEITASDSVPDTLAFAVEGENISTVIPEGKFDLIAGLDISGFERCAALAEALRAMDVPKLLVDHHLNPCVGEFDLVFSDSGVSSTCELLFWILKELEGSAGNLPKATADALMLGMTTDTNNFANSVFPTTLAMAGELLEAGVDRDLLLDRLLHSYRQNRVKAISYLLHKNMRITPEGCAYIIVRRQVYRRYKLTEGELEGMVNIPLTMKDVRMSIYLRQDKGFFRVSIRSKKGVSANALAMKYFNGGGHEQAAGGKLFYPKDIQFKGEAARYIEKVTKEFL